MGYDTNYQLKLASSSDKYIYLSPLLFKQLGREIQEPVHDEYKSDVFTLGLLFLHLSLFESCDDLYIQLDSTINIQVLEDKLARLGKKYSPEYTAVLREMCIIDERLRPDFRALDRKLSSCPKLFGRRICEMVEVPNLYRMKPISYMTEDEVQRKKDIEMKSKAAARQ